MDIENRFPGYHRYIVFALICLLIWGISIIFGQVGFETNDDVVMNMIAAGAYGEPGQYLIYSKYPWGVLLKLLFKVGGGELVLMALSDFEFNRGFRNRLRDN